MFGEDFKQRARLESIATFILSGNELDEDDVTEGNLEEQYTRLEKAHFKSLREMKTRILAEPWDDLDGHESDLKFEDVIDSVIEVGSNMNRLYFQAGLLVGISIAAQLGNF